MAQPAPPQHTNFATWAVSTHGLKTTSIAPALIPGAGLGVIATADIPAGTVIAVTPRAALLNRDTVRSFAPLLPAAEALGTHALLALALAVERRNQKNPWWTWMQTFPSLSEGLRGLPLLWSEAEKALLPRSARRLLTAMETRLKTDWAAVRAVAMVHEATFRWAWAVVNTRTLFYPHRARRGEEDKGGNMTMCPFIDYFNHTSLPTACTATLTEAGYSVTTTTDISCGEEIFVAYGHHSSDFLLVEYGFVPESNHWDALLLDPWLEPLLAKRETLLREQGYWRNWVLDKSGWCYRTEVAVRLLVAGEGRWWRFLAGEEGGEIESAKVKGVIGGIVTAVEEESKEALGKGGEGEVFEMVKQRWGQVNGILEEVRKTLEE
ncbi:hypothetical protein FN846DRAFT_981283 [Sphaerosporella brunnea]|uniref:SET domain-containing protein n=1 Tax=Sphaerosporella brunnea TaxID=1250544 RepID=A0A5J5ECC4_9PEZI|nr:hypothetical protein FN846DRAFT_981283 [Sphaerosporella brunnea]